MTNRVDPKKQTREPFDDPFTGDQELPEQPPARQPGADVVASQAANAGMTSGLPGEIFARPDTELSDTPPDKGEAGREADADEATIGR